MGGEWACLRGERSREEGRNLSTALQAGKKPLTEATPSTPLLRLAEPSEQPPLLYPPPPSFAQSQGVSLGLVTAALKEVLGG